MFAEYTIIGIGNGDVDGNIWMLSHINICEVVLPAPDELKGLHGGYGESAWRFRNQATGELWMKEESPTGFNPREWAIELLSEQEASILEGKYGTLDLDSWKAWVWGSKTGAWHTSVHSLAGPSVIEFRSLYHPLGATAMRKIEDYLASEFSFINIRWVGYDPHKDSTFDVEIESRSSKQELDLAK